MVTLRKSADRGRTAIDWLDSRHSFSFGEYYDPRNMGFRSLRVINDDRIGAGGGFDTHPHRDMEIVTYMVSGSLAHRDSMDNGAVIRPGDVQRMTAGTGVLHSEHNPSDTEPAHLLQIWLRPERPGLAPGYEQRHFADGEKQGRLRLVASRDGRDGSVVIHQDADLYAALLEPGQSVGHTLQPDRHAWLQVVRGSVELNGTPLAVGDAAAVSAENQLQIVGRQPAEVLLFDLA